MEKGGRQAAVGGATFSEDIAWLVSSAKRKKKFIFHVITLL